MLKFDMPKQPELAKHDATLLDLVFVLDCTGSMKAYIQNATDNIHKIVEEIVAGEKSDIRMALVEFRDHPPQEITFVTRTHDFTGSVKKMRDWLGDCVARGGGDGPEAVADGLFDALNLSWRPIATKICILITDAPPHGLIEINDYFPKGCPSGHDPMNIVKQMVKTGIVLYSVGCEPTILPYKDFFSAIAYKTGGQYIPLKDANLLSKVIVGSTLEEISLAKIKNQVQKIVDEQRKSGIVDEIQIAQAVEKELRSSNTSIKKLKLNNESIPSVSDDAMKISKMVNLQDVSVQMKKLSIKKSDKPEPSKEATAIHRISSKSGASKSETKSDDSRFSHFKILPVAEEKVKAKVEEETKEKKNINPPVTHSSILKSYDFDDDERDVTTKTFRGKIPVDDIKEFSRKKQADRNPRLTVVEHAEKK